MRLRSKEDEIIKLSIQSNQEGSKVKQESQHQVILLESKVTELNKTI